jgi:nucleoside-triphosphatase
MHVFLTGQVQIGKSTVIQKTVSLLDLPVGGFRSGFGADRGEAERWLYLWDAAGAPAYDEGHGVVRFTGQGVRVFPERFDEIGGGALRRAREGGAGLILMDECGRFEGQAARFQRELFAALEENTPVLGVVRQGFSGWLDGIRTHPGVTLLTVTAENRDVLPRQVARLLQA